MGWVKKLPVSKRPDRQMAFFASPGGRKAPALFAAQSGLSGPESFAQAVRLSFGELFFSTGLNRFQKPFAVA